MQNYFKKLVETLLVKIANVCGIELFKVHFKTVCCANEHTDECKSDAAFITIKSEDSFKIELPKEGS